MDGLSVRNLNNSIQQTDDLSSRSVQQNQKSQSGSDEIADSFSGTLKKAVDYVDSVQKEADIKMQKLATGQSTDIHGTMIAAEKAEVALKFMVQVRNKIIDAYHEIMKMQV